MPTPTTKNHKLDIFEVLGHLSKNSPGFYVKLTEEEKKALQPLVVMRWMSGTSNASQVYLLNELVNPFVFSLTNHKKLLVDLLSICGPGKTQRYQWKKAGGKKAGKQSLAADVVKEYFKYSTSEAIDVLSLLDDNTIMSYAEQLGRQPDEIKKLKKELTDKK